MIERIEQFIEYLGISVRAFEQKIGASNGLIRKAITNKSDIQSKWITGIVDNFPQINIDWLLTGKGEMLKKGEQPPTNHLNNHSKNIEEHIRELDRVKKGINKDTALLKLLEDNSKLVDANVKLADANLLLAQTNALLSRELINNKDTGKGTSSTAEAV